MTLEAYQPDRLDNLALRILDLAALVRNMASACREAGVTEMPLHDKKAVEWLSKLEDWARKSTADLEVRRIKQKALAAASRTALAESERAKRERSTGKRS